MGGPRHHDFPTLEPNGRKWSIVGSRLGVLTNEYFRPDDVPKEERGPRARSWVWIDEMLLGDGQAEVLTDAHSPHQYSGYELHVRKQPVLTAFSRHDHLIIPDLDLDTDGDQTVSIILGTHFIWTRRNQPIAAFDAFLESAELRDNAPNHDTAAYAFVGILRVLLDSLDRNLNRREQQTYSLEGRFLDPQDVHEDEQELREQFAGQTTARALTQLRIDLAWLRKQYDAFERVVNDLYDPAHGAFRKDDKPELEDEAVPYFQHLSDQIRRALNKIAHLREIHTTLDQLLAAEQAESTNRTLLRLTWLSMFALPVSVIAGIFGMNISIMEEKRTFELDTWIALAAFAIAFLLALWYYTVQKRGQNRLAGREVIPPPKARQAGTA